MEANATFEDARWADHISERLPLLRSRIGLTMASLSCWTLAVPIAAFVRLDKGALLPLSEVYGAVERMCTVSHCRVQCGKTLREAAGVPFRMQQGFLVE